MLQSLLSSTPTQHRPVVNTEAGEGSQSQGFGALSAASSVALHLVLLCHPADPTHLTPHTFIPQGIVPQIGRPFKK